VKSSQKLFYDAQCKWEAGSPLLQGKKSATQLVILRAHGKPTLEQAILALFGPLAATSLNVEVLLGKIGGCAVPEERTRKGGG